MRTMVSFPNPFHRPKTLNVIATDAARVPDSVRVFAFGDVHGRSDLLGELHQMISEDLAMRPPGRSIVIGLGDYIDRGPDSTGVLDLLINLRRYHDTMLLKGNHEALLMSFLDDPSRAGPSWFRNGGWETLVSYDVECSPNTTSEAELIEIRDAFLERIPQAHLAILNSMARSATVGDYFFVHAGARPGVPLANLKERDALWIRDGFSDRDEPFERIVVHGHTPVTDVFVGHHRINLDTGAYATGKLSCIVLQGDNRRFLEVAG